MRLAGKVAVVTGGGSGIGRGIVLAMARAGADIAIPDIQVLNAEKVADEVKALGRRVEAMKTDVTSSADVKVMVDRTRDVLGKIDILVNNAGMAAPPGMPFTNNTEDDWDRAFAVNTKSMFLVSKAFIPGMLKKGRGSIINMASVASSIRGLPNRFVYGASKAAVIGLTKSIAADYVAKGVRCNAICPGTVDTPSLQGRINAFADPVQARKDFVARQPMGRLGTVEDIMGILVFLASDESLFATGNAYSIDGGMTI